MAVLRCKNCDGEVKKDENGFYRCLYCNTVQTFENDPDKDKEDVYKKACSLIREGNIHFLSQAIKLLSDIPDYKDSSLKIEYCIAQIKKQEEEIASRNAFRQRYRAKKKRKRTIIIICVIVTLTVVIGSYSSIRAAWHSIDDVQIEITGVTPEYDGTHYYVYMDFLIRNNTSATLDYVAITSYIEDKNGKSVGTLTTKFGQDYSGVKLNLESGRQITKESYLSVFKNSYQDALFSHLYKKGIADVVITHKITRAKWSDGYQYTDK